MVWFRLHVVPREVKILQTESGTAIARSRGAGGVGSYLMGMEFQVAEMKKIVEICGGGVLNARKLDG